MERCKNCGTKFPNGALGKAEDKAIIRAIKETFYFVEEDDNTGKGKLMRRYKSGGVKVVESKCGMVTLCGGRRVTVRCIISVLTGGPLWKKDEKKKKK